MKKFLSVALVLAMLLGVTTSIFASSLSSKKSATEANINALKDQLASAQADYDAQEKLVNDVIVQVQSKEKLIAELNNQAAELQKNIDTLNANIDKIKVEIEGKKDIVKNNAIVEYTEGDSAIAEVLFNSTDLTALDNSKEYFDVAKEIQDGQISEFQTKQSELVAEEAKVKEEKIKLETNKASVEAEKATLVAKEEELKAAQSQIAAIVQAKNDQIDKENADLANINAAITESKKKYQAQLDKLQKEKGEVIIGSGQLNWPVVGTDKGDISSPYGYRKHPIYGVTKFHSGIDIRTGGKANKIVAADSGIVIFSGVQNGYGNITIIDHGNGMSTRYAHCSALHVKVGDSVQKGEHIANVGSTGASTGYHLHFEVRINGETQDPAKYL